MNRLQKLKEFAKFTTIMVGLILFVGCKKENSDLQIMKTKQISEQLKRGLQQKSIQVHQEMWDKVWFYGGIIKTRLMNRETSHGSLSNDIIH